MSFAKNLTQDVMNFFKNLSCCIYRESKKNIREIRMTRGLKVNGLHNKYALYNLSGVIGDCIKHENALKNLIC